MKSPILMTMITSLFFSTISSSIALYYGKAQGKGLHEDTLLLAENKIKSLEANLDVFRQKYSLLQTSSTVPPTQDQLGDETAETEIKEKLFTSDKGSLDILKAFRSTLDQNASLDICLFAENSGYYSQELLKDPKKLDNLLNAYINIDNRYNRSRMAEILRKVSTDHDNFIHEHVINKIISDPDKINNVLLYKKMSNITNNVQDIDTFKEVLMTTANSEVIANSIDIISDLTLTKMANSDNDVEDVRLDIDEFFSSTDESVRKAALSTLKLHPRRDQVQLLSEALDDDSSKVREAALSVIHTREVNDPQITEELSRTMQSDNSSEKERNLALQALYVVAETDKTVAKMLSDFERR